MTRHKFETTTCAACGLFVEYDPAYGSYFDAAGSSYCGIASDGEHRRTRAPRGYVFEA